MSVSAGQFTDEEKTLIRKFYDELVASYCSEEATAKFYKNNSSIYDQVLRLIDLPFKLMTDELAQIITDDGKTAGDVRVLDVGAGTGLLGQELYGRGFTKLDALDICEGMLTEAESKGVYTKQFPVGIYATETPGISADEYDCVLSSGSFTPGHIQMDALFELARICKKGGVIMYTLSDPSHEMDAMPVQGRAMRDGLLELMFMRKAPYKFNCYQNFERTYCYIVAFRVL